MGDKWAETQSGEELAECPKQYTDEYQQQEDIQLTALKQQPGCKLKHRELHVKSPKVAEFWCNFHMIIKINLFSGE